MKSPSLGERQLARRLENAKLAARREAMELRRSAHAEDVEAIVKEGYKPEEVGEVLRLRAKRLSWQVLGAEATAVMTAELKAIADEFAAAQEQKEERIKLSLFRGLRPLWGSSVDEGGKDFYEDFSPSGEWESFSVPNTELRVEEKLERFSRKKPKRSAR